MTPLVASTSWPTVDTSLLSHTEREQQMTAQWQSYPDEIPEPPANASDPLLWRLAWHSQKRHTPSSPGEPQCPQCHQPWPCQPFYDAKYASEASLELTTEP